ncbi:MAG: ribonuclease HII [Deltaproteobacteria bacterium]|nr:ribonuclease HII [Deltaproteobacteria bacterium]
MMDPDLWFFESQARKKGFARIAGIDEAGRGPLAGPVVAAAVVLPASFSVSGVTDSKKLSAKKRAVLFEAIRNHADDIGVGIVGAQEIDRINILQASLLAMVKAVENLSIVPDYLLVDGIFKIDADLPQAAIIKGDARSISVAAASIVAKETRDDLMRRFDQQYPQYNFARHKGYPTQAHREAIQAFGCCPIHRKSFKGVKDVPNGRPAS